MTAILLGMVALTLNTLVHSQAATGEVKHHIELSEHYGNLANEVSLSAMFFANFLRTGDPGELQLFAQATKRAFESGEVVQSRGTDADRAALDGMAAKYSESVAKAQNQLADIAQGNRQALDSISTSRVEEVATEVSGLAHDRREAAINRADSFERSLKRRSLLTIAAFALGLPMISASYLVTRHYERKDVVRQNEVTRLKRAALTDGLTGLANHRAFQEDLQREVARAARSGQPLSVAMIDVDDFKEVNDSNGHAHGDQVLAQIAGAISLLRVQDRGYRVGGDEFALIMPDTDATGATEALQRLHTSVANGMGGPTISIGLSTSAQGRFRADTLRDHADAALYEAKHRGKNQIVQYTAELGDGSDPSASKMQVIRRVLNSGSVSMWFQPILRVGSAKVLAFEALLRLPDEPQMSGPLEAFEVAQHMGRSRDLDLLCMSKALESGQDLPKDAKLFLNIDPATLVHTDFSAMELLELVRQHNVDPGRVVFEVTERTLAPIPKIAKQVDALRACGFSIALDDVGAGNSGLEMLRLIKFDYVKIDRSVIVDALNEGPGRAVILAIVAFARETGAFMIAEGIETKEMLETIKFDEHALKRFWIQGVQGFLMGEPISSVGGFLNPPPAPRTQAA